VAVNSLIAALAKASIPMLAELERKRRIEELRRVAVDAEFVVVSVEPTEEPPRRFTLFRD
jgi:hypothetical protein